MSAAVAVTTIVAGTLVKLALIGAVLRLLLAVAPRVTMSNPRQQNRTAPDTAPVSVLGGPVTGEGGTP